MAETSRSPRLLNIIAEEPDHEQLKQQVAELFAIIGGLLQDKINTALLDPKQKRERAQKLFASKKRKAIIE